MHPYKHLPSRQFWNQAVSGTPWAEVLRHESGKFRITSADSVASAGSCFAQRISRVIVEAGLNYGFQESPHPLMPPSMAQEQGYGVFSCRYGNVYTTRQLLQLVKEALGLRPPIHSFGSNAAGRVFDLMRPNINKGGFDSIEEAVADRSFHLACVARMLTESDVFIFTLGLTETWLEPGSGVVYGSHPSVVTQQPSPVALQPHNLDYIDCYNDLVEVFNLLHGVNPDLRFILTVSPVALAATHQPQHVLLASTYSKAVLRAVAGRFADLMPQVDYFPSFEIFNLAQSFGQFLSEDLRDVSARGVQVAMANFRAMFLHADPTALPTSACSAVRTGVPATSAAPIAAADVECDEILNAFFARSAAH